MPQNLSNYNNICVRFYTPATTIYKEPSINEIENVCMSACPYVFGSTAMGSFEILHGDVYYNRDIED